MNLNYLEKLIKRANKAMGKETGAKLSTKQRKKLKKSTFCGPGRSFPVNDCAHYTAALRLLNRSKYSSSTKKRIRACINRKGKKLGCGGAKKAKAHIEELGINVNDVINPTVLEHYLKSEFERIGINLDLPNDVELSCFKEAKEISLA